MSDSDGDWHGAGRRSCCQHSRESLMHPVFSSYGPEKGLSYFD